VVATGSGGRQRFLADITPDGHHLINELGFQAFSERLIAMLPSVLRREDCLAFRRAHGWILEGRPSAGREDRPGILSWLSEPNRHRLLLAVDAEVIYFQGHFPGNPILPGVAQLHWAAGMAMSLFGFKQVPLEVKRLKFRNIIRPSSVLELVLEYSKKGEVEFRFTSFGQVHSTGCLCFREELPC